ncbi:MAG: RNA methyltransferase [Chitinophagales bacterium]
MHIKSVQNPRIRNLKKLDKASERREQQLFLVEGLREVCLALKAGYSLSELFICESILHENEIYNLKDFQLPQPFFLSEEVYNAVAYRGGTEGVMATFKIREHLLDDLMLKNQSLILIIEGVEKPGNLGAMLRTADAAAVDAVIICDTRTDLYNPNVIRSGIGTVFTNQIAIANLEEVLTFLKAKNVQLFAAELESSDWYYECDFTAATAIAVGTEATGLSPNLIAAAHKRIKIPMGGAIDSLNVSVSAAILLFEAVRQRSIT